MTPGRFTVYLDGLFKNVLHSGVGCRVGDIFAGSLGYADDIVFLTPSSDALKFMVSKCEAYAYDCNILLNPWKSKLVCFNVNIDNVDLHVNNETYLKVSINSGITNKSITQTVRSFYQKNNHVMSIYSMLDSFTRCKIHTRFSMSRLVVNYETVLVDIFKRCVLLEERQ